MTLPVAGWYDDPADAEQLRWWTGDAWSEARERREPVIAAPAEPSVADPVLPWAADPSLPLPYGPASVTGVAAASEPTGEPASEPAVEPAGPPPVPPFAAAAQGGLPAGPPVTVATDAPGSTPQPRQKNSFALAGLLVGLAALAFNPLGITGLLTIVFGVLGLRRATELKKAGAPITGFGQAVAALVFGGIACLRLLGIFGMVG